jgi:hypothetical protein
MTVSDALGRGIVPAGIDQPYRQGGPGLHLALAPYGTQTQRVWAAADTDEKSVLDAMRSEFLWRASAQGENVVLRLTYGTQATLIVDNIRLPFVGFIPGQAQLVARKVDPAASAVCRLTLTAATGGISMIRAVVGIGALPPNAGTYTALTASTLTVAGVAGIAVAVGATLPIVAPSAVTAGSGIVELTL